MKKKISKLFEAFIKANDTPQKKALGFGLGAFLGILPGTGPIAGLILASFFRLNRLSALLGSLITNTWISLVLFIPAVKVGAWIWRINWQDLARDWQKMILPVLFGYLITAFCVGVIAYLIALALFSFDKMGIICYIHKQKGGCK